MRSTIRTIGFVAFAALGCASPRPAAVAVAPTSQAEILVYAAVLDALGDRTATLYLADSTSGVTPLQAIGPATEAHSDQRVSYFATKLDVPDTLVRQFLRQNRNRAGLSAAQFPDHMVRLVDSSHALAERTRGYGVAEVSRIAFSADSGTALVYLGWSRIMAGEGQVFRLEKTADGYHITAVATAWMM
jgi:hypothetical protein